MSVYGLNNKDGFTIIELLIATTVFSVILLMLTAGFIQIGNAYYKGVLQSRTQQTARNIIDEVSRGIQLSGEQVKTTAPLSVGTSYPTAGANFGICVNGTGYSYIIDNQLSQAPSGSDQVSRALVSYSANCSSFGVADISAVSPRKELLGFGMRLTALDVQVVSGQSDTYRVTVGVASGERDMFSPDFGSGISSSCKSQAGKQFCAASTLTTIVQKRVK